MSIARIVSVYVGRIAPLGPDGVPSAFLKATIDGTVAVGALGLAGDAQADLAVHGGLDKAVYAYSLARYPAWRAAFPALAQRFVAGSMGENLAIDGIDEDDVCVGDVHAVGSALLQVCQPRQPCFKLSLALGEPRLGKHMVRSGHSGWYYRVMRAGGLAVDDGVILHDRPNPDFAFARLVEIVNRGGASAAEARALATMHGVAVGIAQHMRSAL